MRGDEDGADAAIAAALERAATLAHPLTETYVYTVAALLAQMQDDPDAALHRAKQAVTVASEHAIPVFEALASPLAWATARLELGDGISLQRQALSGMARTGTAATLTAAMATLAELLGAAGDTDGARHRRPGPNGRAKHRRAVLPTRTSRIQAQLLMARRDGRRRGRRRLSDIGRRHSRLDAIRGQGTPSTRRALPGV